MKLSDLLRIIKTDLADLSPLEEPDFRLEQAEKKGNKWEVVCSYLVPNTNKKLTGINALTSIGGFEYARLYKKVIISNNEEVEGIYIFKE